MPIYLVARMQAMVRGARARKYVKMVYGFEASPGLKRSLGMLEEIDDE